MKTFAIFALATGLVFRASAEPAITNAAPSQPRAEFFQRVYQTETNSFFANARRLVRAKDEQSNWDVLMAALKQKGVEVSPPFSLYYKPRTGLLLIRATEEDQKRIKLLLEELQPPK